MAFCSVCEEKNVLDVDFIRSLRGDDIFISKRPKIFTNTSEHILDSFIVNKITKDFQTKTICIICQENYQIGDDSVILPCIHQFHKNCLQPWLKHNDKCPYCRTKISFDIQNFS